MLTGAIFLYLVQQAAPWAASTVPLLSDAGLELRPEAFLWVLSHCARVGAEAGRACAVLSLVRFSAFAQIRIIFLLFSVFFEQLCLTVRWYTNGTQAAHAGVLQHEGAAEVALYSALINVAAKQRRGANFPLGTVTCAS